jgi:hypothetical protein
MPVIFALLYSLLPLSASAFLVMVRQDIPPLAAGNTLILALLLGAAQFWLIGLGGAKSLLGASLGVSCFGSLGMAIGALMEHKHRPACCLSVFDLDTLLGWPTLLMCLFCAAGSLVYNQWIARDGRVCVGCGWISLAAMYLGMGLAARYLAPPLTPVFGAAPAMHWAMFAGMAAAHLMESGAIRLLNGTTWFTPRPITSRSRGPAHRADCRPEPGEPTLPCRPL